MKLPDIRALLQAAEGARSHASTFFAAAILALTFALPQSIGAQEPQSMAIRFAGGETIVESETGIDHVVVRDAGGKTTAESWCDSGTFSAYQALFTSLKEAAVQNHRAALAKLFSYPLRVNGSKILTVRSEASLLNTYDEVFTKKVLDEIQSAEPAAVFCRNGLGMLGNGVVWADASAGDAKVVVVNQ